MKVVHFWKTLVGCRGSQKFNVFGWVALTESQLVDFFFAGEDVTVALEQTLLDVVVDGEADGLDLHAD